MRKFVVRQLGNPYRKLGVASVAHKHCSTVGHQGTSHQGAAVKLSSLDVEDDSVHYQPKPSGSRPPEGGSAPVSPAPHAAPKAPHPLAILDAVMRSDRGAANLYTQLLTSIALGDADASAEFARKLAQVVSNGPDPQPPHAKEHPSTSTEGVKGGATPPTECCPASPLSQTRPAPAPSTSSKEQVPLGDPIAAANEFVGTVLGFKKKAEEAQGKGSAVAPLTAAGPTRHIPLEVLLIDSAFEVPDGGLIPVDLLKPILPAEFADCVFLPKLTEPEEDFILDHYLRHDPTELKRLKAIIAKNVSETLAENGAYIDVTRPSGANHFEEETKFVEAVNAKKGRNVEGRRGLAEYSNLVVRVSPPPLIELLQLPGAKALIEEATAKLALTRSKPLSPVERGLILFESLFSLLARTRSQKSQTSIHTRPFTKNLPEQSQSHPQHEAIPLPHMQYTLGLKNSLTEALALRNDARPEDELKSDGAATLLTERILQALHKPFLDAPLKKATIALTGEDHSSDHQKELGELLAQPLFPFPLILRLRVKRSLRPKGE
jgi:hypothetical protein